MSGSSSYATGCKLAYSRPSAPPRRRNGRAQAAGKSHDVDESGFTIIELLLSVLILSIIIGLSTTTVRMFYAQSANVQNTYAATNQVLLASEILTEYTHDGVASCPAPTATPGDAACTSANGEQPFATATSSSATFFADTDDVSLTSGPVEVSISLSGTTLTATVAKPTGGCPLTSTPTTVCAYGTARTIATVTNETNATPLSYLIGTGGPPPAPTGGSCSNASVASPTAAQITEIAAVCIDLDSQLKGGQTAGYQSLAYLLSPAYTMNAG
jgi:prepilin-type N-terminal cleavage/methylation domain-containing protein